MRPVCGCGWTGKPRYFHRFAINEWLHHLEQALANEPGKKP
jgi:hypothetical protein